MYKISNLIWDFKWSKIFKIQTISLSKARTIYYFSNALQ